MRWVCWFLLAPQAWLLAGWLHEAGGPMVDVGALACLWLAMFADTRALPLLLLGVAAGRALVDEASVPVQMLVLGVPVAVLLPLRAYLHLQQIGWQVAIAAVFAIAVPRWSGLCGQWFDQPSFAVLDTTCVAVTALLGPFALWLLRRLPPLAAFAERTA